MGNAKRKKKPPRDTRIAPTAEQQAHGNYASAGMAYRRIPMIDTLRDMGKLTDEQHRRLTHYRDQEAVAGGSLTKSCLDVRIAGGRGDIPMSAAVVSANIAIGRIEKELGSLRDFVYHVAIKDWSLSRWCCEQYGSRERYDGKGKFVALVPLNEKVVMPRALLDLRMGAGRIVA